MTRLATKMVLLGSLAGLAVAGAAVASAESVDAPPSLVVHFSADMLATDSGARSVYHRLERAAELVCPNEPSFGRLNSPVVIKCRAQAVADAVNKIHNERLAEVHAAASSKSG